MHSSPLGVLFVMGPRSDEDRGPFAYLQLLTTEDGRAATADTVAQAVGRPSRYHWLLGASKEGTVGHLSMPEEWLALQPAALQTITTGRRFNALRNLIWPRRRHLKAHSEQFGCGPTLLMGVSIALGAGMLHPVALISVLAIYSVSRVAVKLISCYQRNAHERSRGRIRRAAVEGRIPVETAVSLLRADDPPPAAEPREATEPPPQALTASHNDSAIARRAVVSGRRRGGRVLRPRR
jgi:hypothetical protein